MPKNPQKINTKIGYIRPREITEEMKESYIDYAMSVIISRALPDVRDGLKPVHRRILYSMWEMGLKYDAKFRKSATVVGECFVKDTMVLTKRGLIPIQEIKVGDLVYTQKGIQKVIQLYEMPKKPLLKVTLENGISNIVTYSQKFKVLTEDWKFKWKEAKDLTKNDYLVIKAAYPEINNFVKLNRIEKNQPQYLNEDLAYLLGILISDGCLSEDYGRKKYPRINFGLGEAKEKAAERIISIFKKEFHYNPTLEVDNYQYRTKSGEILNNKRYQIRINRKSINEFFLSNFELKGLKAPSKRIPSKIFQSPPKVIFSFISGLIDGDGCVMPRKHCIQYGSSSKKLIDGLLILLLHQGIFSSKYLRKNKEGGYINGRVVKGRYQPYSLEIRGKNATLLAKSLNLASLIKRKKIQKIISQGEKRRDCGFQYDIIPYAGRMLFGELRKNHLGAGWYQDINGNKFRMGIKHRAGCKIRYSSDLWEKPLRKTQVIDWGIKNKLERIGSPLFEFLDHVLKNKIYFIKISSIRKVSPQKTYDFEVEKDHELIANGVVSHNCLGKYHPHGDQAVYDAAMRMAQDFSLRYPLIQGQGNVGSIDDPSEYAAMRYTEMKMSKIGEEMLRDIEKNTVDFMDNYDGTRKEPTVLPSPLPQLLLNGSLGIAVGMATNIPPHNLSEICQALIYLIDHPKADTEDLFKFIKGPDFPTGGLIYDQKGIISAYSQGRGPILVRGKAEISETEKGKNQIIITEIPFQVQKSSLVEQFANLVSEKKIEGIKDIRDESDKEGLRIVIDLQREAHPQKVLNYLYKFTDLQKTFHLNLLALVEGIQPKVLNLPQILDYFLSHRREVVIRRTKFDLEKAKERTHILEGLAKCLQKIDAVIRTIKLSANREQAEKNLIRRFKLTKIQANAILETRLSALAKLERKKIEDELKQTKIKIKELSAILKSPQKIKEVIKKELKELIEKFGDERRTKVYIQKIGEISEVDLIPQEETIITLTQGGYIKRTNPSAYKIQKRGGRGILGLKTIGEDIVEHFLLAKTHDNLLFFTDSGKVFKTPVYEIPEGQRLARGRGLLNFLELSSQEKVLSLIPLGKEEVLERKHLVMVTKKGLIKKTNLKEFENIRRSGLQAILLKKGDSLKKVVKLREDEEIILATKLGQAIRFRGREIREMGRQASGVKAIRLKKDDEVVAMDSLPPSGLQAQAKKEFPRYLLIITENGFGKKTELKQFRLQKRGGAGIKIAKISQKSGNLVASMVLSSEPEDLIVISQKGQVIRIRISQIPRLSRLAQGVRIMKLEEGDHVASATCL